MHSCLIILASLLCKSLCDCLYTQIMILLKHTLMPRACQNIGSWPTKPFIYFPITEHSQSSVGPKTVEIFPLDHYPWPGLSHMPDQANTLPLRPGYPSQLQYPCGTCEHALRMPYRPNFWCVYRHHCHRPTSIEQPICLSPLALSGS